MRLPKRSANLRIGGLLVLLGPLLEVTALAQAVGFQPVPAPLPSGVGLEVTPAVSADRRYVRMGVNAGFNDITGFSNFSVPAVVGGGAAGMNGPIGGAAAGAGAGGAAGGVVGRGGATRGVVGGAVGGAPGFVGSPFGAFGMTNSPFAFAVSPVMNPLYSWNSYGLMPPLQINTWGANYGPQGGMDPMSRAGLPPLTAPGLGEPLTTTDLPAPVAGSDASDPFDQARNQPGPGAMRGQGAVQAERSTPRTRSRTRTGRAPRRAVTPRRGRTTQAAPAPQGQGADFFPAVPR